MRRAKHPVHPAIKDLQRNLSTGFYEITEDGVTYSMTLEMTRKLKAYYRAFMPESNQKIPTLASWYKDLGSIQRKEVITKGKSSTSPTDFFPDFIPED